MLHFLSVTLVIVSGSLTGAAAVAHGTEPPVNKFLADSSWPMTHGGTYNQDSSAAPGPTLDDLKHGVEFVQASTEPVPITLAISSAYADGRRAVWGNTKGQIFKIAIVTEGSSLVRRQDRPVEASTEITGAYALIDKDMNYIVPRDLAIDVFTDATPGDLDSGIVSLSYDLCPQLSDPTIGERIVGLNMTFDGFLVFATNFGRVGVITRKGLIVAEMQLGPGPREISNSLAVDEKGGIYVLTDKDLQKLRWNGTTLANEWSVGYASDDFRSPGRLGKGSGTTPTLMGAGDDDDRLVVFSDGREEMHVLAVWRDAVPADWQGLPGADRRIAADLPVTFGKDRPNRAITEQSIAVWGYGAALVDNSYGDIGPLAARIARRRGYDLQKATIFLSNTPGVAPYGVEKFVWNPVENRLYSAWTRNDISCPNGIPAVSGASQLFYCIGQRQTKWNIEALHWEDGESAFVLPLGKQNSWNSFYAGLEIGPWRSLLSGTYGGGLLVQPKP